MTEIFLVPLNKLDVDPKNVRKTYSTEGIEALAANIRADGYTLLQNLVVRKGNKRGRYFVTAGGRRRAALELLAKAGEIAKTFPVECKERSADEATGISLTENTMREDMHPVDQFEAFRALADEGKAIADIAARYGITETIVRRRLALARVSPRLLERYRAEEMPFDQLTAFTICDDHARQEEVWDSLPSWSRSAHAIRRALTGEAVSSTDKRVVFIGGLDAYEAAGGVVKRDLFDADGGGYATDIAALDRIVAEKLEAAAETVRGEGWKWVECDIALPDHVCSLTRIYPESVPLSDPEQAELDRLAEEYDDLAERIEAEDGDEDLSEQLETVSERIDQAQAATQTYDAERKATAGAFVVLDYHGGLRIERGFVLAEDEAAEADEPADNSGQGSEPENPS